MSHVTQQEVDDLFRRILSGEVAVTVYSDESKYGVYCGDYEYETSDGWRFNAFIDCGGYDYLNSVTSPDGRTTSAEYLDFSCEALDDHDRRTWDMEFLGVQASCGRAFKTRVRFAKP